VSARERRALLSLLLVGCLGPPAPDVEVCRDVIRKVCGACSQAQQEVDATAQCADTLLSRTGCRADDFVFTAPDRSQVLACREGLLTGGTAVVSVPPCEDAVNALRGCPELTVFLRGRR
jgi:hypothetical protein